jgi:hypothetical protein
MNDLIQKLIEIDSLDAQIQSLWLENPSSTRIVPRKEKRDRLLKEAFTALCREYYRNATWTPDRPTPKSMTEVIKVIKEITDVAKMRIFNACNYRTDEETALIVATSVIKKCDLAAFADHIEDLTGCGLLEEERLEEISCSVCGESLYVDKPQYPLGESFSAKCNRCHHIEEIANTSISSDVVQPVDNQSVRTVIARSPDFLDEKTKAWLLDKICNTNLSFDEISNEAEALEPTCIVALWHFIDTLQEQRYNEDYLRHYSIEELKTFIEEKVVEADIARQKLHLNNLIDNSTAECYHTERMLALIKEAASAIAASGGNPEILAKLQGYIDLSN